jgi:phospholipid/cholesterol/gamma-HCH transport system substrate-binding protein
MITSRTKIQLLIFVAITLLGVTYVGARYAQLDRLILDDTYEVAAHVPDSGGVFEGAEVTYRGVTVGRVSDMKLTEEGVDVILAIDNAEDDIPADTRALVGNRSAVGEQYVELQPYTNGEPFLKDGSEIEQSDTAIPISSTKWLNDTNKLVESVDKQDLRTVVSEFGAAFEGGGDDLTRLIDTSSSFIEVANENFDITKKLIRESNVVLDTQLDKASAIRSFARDLALFSTTLAKSDPDLRRVIANGSATANQLRTFLEENGVDLGKLINNLVTTGEIQIKHLDGTRMILILYPYVVAGGFVVNDKTPETGLYDAHFGLMLQQNPHVCRDGYRSTNRRPPQDGSNAPMNMKARCTEPQAQSNPRGAQHAPTPPRRVAPGTEPVVATYDRTTGEVTYGEELGGPVVTTSAGANDMFGEESWKWLLLQPLVRQQ